MNKSDDSNEMPEDERFAQQARALFEQSVDGLDGQTQSRLNQGRQAALARPGNGFGRWTQWVPATGVAAAAVVAVAIWNAAPGVDPLAPALPGDFEILMNDDSFDMLQDLEFYSWIEIDAELQLAPPADADVG